MPFCPDCQEWMFADQVLYPHTCPPIFMVWCPERDEDENDARAIHAPDASSAVEKWAERDDAESAEYAIVSQREEPTVHVRPPGVKGRAAEPLRFKVMGEASPVYNATALTDEEGEGE